MKNVIKGDKVYFSHFVEEYFGIIANAQWDNYFLRSLSWDAFHPWNIENWKQFEGDNDDNGRFLFALKEKEEDTFIGWVSLSDVQFKNRGAELSIAILDEKNRHKGYGTDALNLMCKFGFYELGLHKIRLSVHSNNEGAIKLYEKIGFKKEGIDREGLFQDGKWLDVYYYGLLLNDWQYS
ncbi:GNAT family N-acetyltransferase [Desemzia sp. RIT804]|uniref:GNAT family N-acetyltransferase n=1 Tax=Desemzia sp. RIT 804 TaxID=2810209 RepID=UPI00194EBA67|nr:GNAT family protein [Desemzia sp. RIT 804]MBM6614870.1 GNAT family N-acetyltransferase [Desemzia sp. RIT 804]